MADNEGVDVTILGSDVATFNGRYTINPDTGCWLWRGSVGSTGYSRFAMRVAGEAKRRTIGAHVFSYMLHVGEVPAKMRVCHSCDEVLCVNPEHLELLTAGQEALRRTEPLSDRILRHVVETENSCWEFMGQRDRLGYGRTSAGRGSSLIHRIIYEHFKGAIPEGLVLDHLCRNPPCCNPDHLDPKTVRGNQLAPGSLAFGAINAAKTHCPQGHELAEPNLVPSAMKRGRMCLACNRAHAYIRIGKTRGQDLELQSTSDRYYEAIMGKPFRSAA